MCNSHVTLLTNQSSSLVFASSSMSKSDKSQSSSTGSCVRLYSHVVCELVWREGGRGEGEGWREGERRERGRGREGKRV